MFLIKSFGASLALSGSHSSSQPTTIRFGVVSSTMDVMQLGKAQGLNHKSGAHMLFRIKVRLCATRPFHVQAKVNETRTLTPDNSPDFYLDAACGERGRRQPREGAHPLRGRRPP